MAKAARQAAITYQMTAKQVRQQVAFALSKPYIPQGEPDPWDTMTRAEKRDYMLEQIQNAQQAGMAAGHESVKFWADLIQFNAGYFQDVQSTLAAAGFFFRTVNNNIDNYDEFEISARPFG